MALISDNTKSKKLQDLHINIKTKYIVGNKILERNSNDSYNDDIKNGIRCEKEYYLDNKLIHSEKIFDSRIEYTFISKNQENTEYTCPNCGMHAKLHDFIDGCPYCKTYYNLDYTEKDLGSKYHYDRVIRSSKYRVITAIIDVILSLIISYIFIKCTSRTFNSYDISKIFIYGIILSLILYYFFYVIDGYIILGPIKKYKDGQNQKQINFWNRTKIDKKKFFNNINYEVANMYYNDPEIIDFDIIDFDSFEDYKLNKDLYVKVKAYVRIIRYKNCKITKSYVVDTYNMKKNNSEILEIKNGVNIINCLNCGASIDITKGKCEFCGTTIPCLQEWIIEK